MYFKKKYNKLIELGYISLTSEQATNEFVIYCKSRGTNIEVAVVGTIYTIKPY